MRIFSVLLFVIFGILPTVFQPGFLQAAELVPRLVLSSEEHGEIAIPTTLQEPSLTDCEACAQLGREARPLPAAIIRSQSIFHKNGTTSVKSMIELHSGQNISNKVMLRFSVDTQFVGSELKYVMLGTWEILGTYEQTGHQQAERQLSGTAKAYVTHPQIPVKYKLYNFPRLNEIARAGQKKRQSRL